MNALFLAAEGTAEHSDVLFTIPGINLPVTSAVTTMWGVMLLLFFIGWIGTRRLAIIPHRRAQALVEFIVDGLMGFFATLIGKKRARQFLPILASLFLFILFSNYSGLLPGAGHIRGLRQPTSNWGVTAGLAGIVFVLVLFYGLKERGLRYFEHMVQPIYLAPLMIPLGLIEEVVRPFALSLRLVANMFGGETVVLALLMAVPWFLPIIPMALEIIFGAIQALIFAFLTAIYLSSAVEEAHH
ncbi:MAG: F0F1 ATP synthase subunit A [Bacillota bacterium]